MSVPLGSPQTLIAVTQQKGGAVGALLITRWVYVSRVDMQSSTVRYNSSLYCESRLSSKVDLKVEMESQCRAQFSNVKTETKNRNRNFNQKNRRKDALLCRVIKPVYREWGGELINLKTLIISMCNQIIGEKCQQCTCLQTTGVLKLYMSSCCNFRFNFQDHVVALHLRLNLG